MLKRKGEQTFWSSIGNFITNLLPSWATNDTTSQKELQPQEGFELPVAKKRKYETQHHEVLNETRNPSTELVKPIPTKLNDSKTPLDVMKTFVHKNTKNEFKKEIIRKNVPNSAFGKPLKTPQTLTPFNSFGKRNGLNFSMNDSKFNLFGNKRDDSILLEDGNQSILGEKRKFDHSEIYTPVRRTHEENQHQNNDVKKLMDNLDRIYTPLMDVKRNSSKPLSLRLSALKKKREEKKKQEVVQNEQISTNFEQQYSTEFELFNKDNAKKTVLQEDKYETLHKKPEPKTKTKLFDRPEPEPLPKKKREPIEPVEEKEQEDFFMPTEGLKHDMFTVGMEKQPEKEKSDFGFSFDAPPKTNEPEGFKSVDTFLDSKVSTKPVEITEEFYNGGDKEEDDSSASDSEPEEPEFKPLTGFAFDSKPTESTDTSVFMFGQTSSDLNLDKQEEKPLENKSEEKESFGFGVSSLNVSEEKQQEKQQDAPLSFGFGNSETKSETKSESAPDTNVFMFGSHNDTTTTSQSTGFGFGGGDSNIGFGNTESKPTIDTPMTATSLFGSSLFDDKPTTTTAPSMDSGFGQTSFDGFSSSGTGFSSGDQSSFGFQSSETTSSFGNDFNSSGQSQSSFGFGGQSTPSFSGSQSTPSFSGSQNTFGFGGGNQTSQFGFGGGNQDSGAFSPTSGQTVGTKPILRGRRKIGK